MRFGVVAVIATVAAVAMSGCGSVITPNGGNGLPGGAPGGVNTSVDVCSLFTQSEASSILGASVTPQSRNGIGHCGYEIQIPSGAIAGGSLSVSVRAASTATTLASRAQLLRLTVKVDGVGDEAYSDGKLTLLAVKHGVEIQAVFVNIGDATTVDPLTAMKRAASDVANGL